MDSGVRTDGLFLVQLRPRPGAYADLDDGHYYRELVERFTALPGVRSVALTSALPALGLDSRPSVLVTRADHERVSVNVPLRAVAPGFFGTTGIPILSGRDVSWHDTADAPRVVVLSASLASDLFPAEAAVGRRISIGSDPERSSVEVVGIVGDARLEDLRVVHPRAAFLPALQDPGALRWSVVVVRAVSGAAHPDAFRRAVESLGREYVSGIQTFGDRLHGSLARERMLASILLFGGLALALVTAGVFGLQAYEVRRRNREIGVRLALGATPGDIRMMVLTRGARATALGFVFGLPLVLGGYPAIRGLLYEAPSPHAGIIASVALLLLTVTWLAVLVPARNASRVDPIETLRSE